MSERSAQKDLTLVILCGGKSSRMGEDKSLLPFASYSTLVEYQYQRLQPHFKNVFLSSKVNKFDFLDNEDKIIFDEGEIHSPMVALKSILQTIQEDKVFILTVDTPFVRIETIHKLFEVSNDYEITLAKTQRLHNLCGVFSTAILQRVIDALKEDIHKIGYLIKQSQTQTIPFDDENEFLNLNEKEEYTQALSIIRKTNN